MRILRFCLKIFEVISGFKVNLSKSCLVGIHVDEHWLIVLANVIGCKVGILPSKMFRAFFGWSSLVYILLGSSGHEGIQEACMLGKMKLNFDGFSLGNLGPVGCGCNGCDDSFNVIFLLSGPLGSCYSMRGELLGLPAGLRELNTLGIHGCLVLGDLTVVISWDRWERDVLWQLAHYIQETKDLMWVIDIFLRRISRKQNEEAGKLTRWGVELTRISKGIIF